MTSPLFLTSILTFILRIFPPKMALIWFWVTMLMTFYCGVFHVLPSIYNGDSYWLLVVTKLLSFFLIGQMIINWFCIRIVSSRYRPTYRQQFYEHLYLNDIDGFEIDLDQLRYTKKRPLRKNRDTYSLPLTGIRPIGNNADLQWNHDTMYLVALNEEEACFITSNDPIKKTSNALDYRLTDIPTNAIDNAINDSHDQDIENLNTDECLNLSISENRSSKIISEKFSNHCDTTNGRLHSKCSTDRKINKVNGTKSINHKLMKHSTDDLPTADKCQKCSPYELNDECPNSSSSNPSKSNVDYFSTSTSSDPGSKAKSHKVIVYPYWSWKPCRHCGFVRPPRAHHCKLCGYCVLKRDHHCFFAVNCVGLNNQRHFLVFLFWTCCAISFCLVHSALYILNRCVYNESCATVGKSDTDYDVLVGTSDGTKINSSSGNVFGCLADIILPVTIVRIFQGRCTVIDLCLVLVLYSLIWFAFVCGGFLFDQVMLVLSSRTSFEKENRIRIISSDKTDKNSTEDTNHHENELHSSYPKQKFTDSNRTNDSIDKSIQLAHHWNRCFYWVFGERWMLNFLLPLHFIYPCPEDGISWKSIEFCAGTKV